MTGGDQRKVQIKDRYKSKTGTDKRQEQTKNRCRSEKVRGSWRRITMNAEKIDRINALYHKSQAVGLTEEERKEQQLLREEYIAAVRGNLRAQLNSIDVVDADGKIENLGEKYGKRELS